jgi:hypothetical protein
MSMMRYGCLLTILLVCHPVLALGDARSHRKAAETLLLVMEIDKDPPTLVAQVLEGQLHQNPQLGPHREALQRFLTKYLNWESVKEDTITAYTQAFTEQELKQLTEFYKTPLGKKANENMPRLALVPGQIGLKRAQENQAELGQMIEDERSKKQ